MADDICVPGSGLDFFWKKPICATELYLYFRGYCNYYYYFQNGGRNLVSSTFFQKKWITTESNLCL